MATNCKYYSTEPIIQDTYKVPDLRHLCSSTKRNEDFTFFSDRFIGPDDCENCPYREDLPE